MSRQAPSGLATEPRDCYTLHLVPPYQHAAHYSGSTEPGRLASRMGEHASGRGARLTQVQRKAGGSWVLADVRHGTRDTEQQLKERGRSRDCSVCKAGRAYKAGELDAPRALRAAGWDRMTPYEKGLLVQALGIPEVPAELAADLSKPDPVPFKAIEQKWPQPVAHLSPADEALSDQLVAKWRAELNMPPMPEPARERSYELGA